MNMEQPYPEVRTCANCRSSNTDVNLDHCGDCGCAEGIHGFKSQNDSPDLLQPGMGLSTPVEEKFDFFLAPRVEPEYIGMEDADVVTMEYDRKSYHDGTRKHLAVPGHRPLSPTNSLLDETPSSYPGELSCPHVDCNRKFTGKYRRGTLHRHMRLKHVTGQDSGDQERRYICDVEGCNKVYKRRDALLKHQRIKHPELRIPPPIRQRAELSPSSSRTEIQRQLLGSDQTDWRAGFDNDPLPYVESYDDARLGLSVPSITTPSHSPEEEFEASGLSYSGLSDQLELPTITLSTYGVDSTTSGSGMLHSDKQPQVHLFDHATERQLSHTEAKQFSQRHQLVTQYGGLQDGHSPSQQFTAQKQQQIFDQELLQDYLESTRPNTFAGMQDDRLMDAGSYDWDSPKPRGNEMNEENKADQGSRDNNKYTTDTNPSGDKILPRLFESDHMPDDIRQQRYFEDDGDTISVLSCADSMMSIFSSNSGFSSATGISSFNGYSSGDIATASKTLSSIFHEDEDMFTLYKIALANAAIGPERLQRNLRRLFKAFSEHLKVEATDQLEYLAARLVAVKSRGLAKSIVEQFPSGTVESQTIGHGECSDSSEEERDSRPVNEETLADLIAFRRFLIESQAFETLQAQLRAFVLPKLPKPVPEYSHDDKTTHVPDGSISLHVKPSNREDSTSRTWQLWRRDAAEAAYAYLCNTEGLPRTTLLLHLMVDLVFLASDATLVNTGLLEPPLCPTKIRLRWSSMNGDAMFSDVEELEQGGVAELVDRMERTSGVKVTASSYRQYAGGQQYPMPRPDRWLKNGIAKAASAFTKPSRPSPLPQHSAPCAPIVGSSVTQNGSSLKVLHLMACIHRDSKRKYVKQDCIENVTTDRELLWFMRQKYVDQHRSTLRLLEIKQVKGIYFVKFWLPIGGSVDVRHHNQCSDSCDCIPPLAKVEPPATAEYKCSPIPPKTRPPIPPEYLSMLFYYPSEAAENDIWVFNQLPKRTCGQLQGEPGQPAEGWGIYYQEVWDKELITLALFIMLVLGTLLFGVLWAKYKFDVQGAFGISAWMASLGGMLLFVLVPRLEKIGQP